MKKLLALIFCCVIYSPLMADEIEPDDAIKYRKAVMTAVKGHNNAIRSIVTRKVPFTNKLSGHIDALDKLFSELDTIFPEGSDFGKTNAKDAIWDNPEKFSKSIQDAKQALNTFRSVAQQGDLGKTAGAFKKFGKASCGGCHKSFKKKDD